MGNSSWARDRRGEAWMMPFAVSSRNAAGPDP
jgi:hypothetical protein